MKKSLYSELLSLAENTPFGICELVYGSELILFKARIFLIKENFQKKFESDMIAAFGWQYVIYKILGKI